MGRNPVSKQPRPATKVKPLPKKLNAAQVQAQMDNNSARRQAAELLRTEWQCSCTETFSSKGAYIAHGLTCEIKLHPKFDGSRLPKQSEVLCGGILGLRSCRGVFDDNPIIARCPTDLCMDLFANKLGIEHTRRGDDRHTRDSARPKIADLLVEHPHAMAGINCNDPTAPSRCGDLECFYFVEPTEDLTQAMKNRHNHNYWTTEQAVNNLSRLEQIAGTFLQNENWKSVGQALEQQIEGEQRRLDDAKKADAKERAANPPASLKKAYKTMRETLDPTIRIDITNYVDAGDGPNCFVCGSNRSADECWKSANGQRVCSGCAGRKPTVMLVVLPTGEECAHCTAHSSASFTPYRVGEKLCWACHRELNPKVLREGDCAEIVDGVACRTKWDPRWGTLAEREGKFCGSHRAIGMRLRKAEAEAEAKRLEEEARMEEQEARQGVDHGDSQDVHDPSLRLPMDPDADSSMDSFQSLDSSAPKARPTRKGVLGTILSRQIDAGIDKRTRKVLLPAPPRKRVKVARIQTIVEDGNGYPRNPTGVKPGPIHKTTLPFPARERFVFSGNWSMPFHSVEEDVLTLPVVARPSQKRSGRKSKTDVSEISSRSQF